MDRKINQFFFDKVARTYDESTAGTWMSPSAVALKTAPLLSRHSNLLDFGVGTGQVLSKLNVSSGCCRVFAVDIASGMIDVCRQKFPFITARQIESVTDIHEFMWPAFDLIVSSGVFEYIERVEEVIGTLRSLLSSRGELVFTYQPIIGGHPTQSRRVSVSHRSDDTVMVVGKGIAQGLETIVHRWHQHEITAFVCAAELEIVEHESFIAHYASAPNLVPKIYNLVRSKYRK